MQSGVGDASSEADALLKNEEMEGDGRTASEAPTTGTVGTERMQQMELVWTVECQVCTLWRLPRRGRLLYRASVVLRVGAPTATPIYIHEHER